MDKEKVLHIKHYTFTLHIKHYQTITFIYGLTEANCPCMTGGNVENSTGVIVILNCVPAL